MQQVVGSRERRKGERGVKTPLERVPWSGPALAGKPGERAGRLKKNVLGHSVGAGTSGQRSANMNTSASDTVGGQWRSCSGLPARGCRAEQEQSLVVAQRADRGPRNHQSGEDGKSTMFAGDHASKMARRSGGVRMQEAGRGASARGDCNE